MSIYRMTAWTELVSKVFKEKRSTNKNYKFKNALVDAKKLYRKTTKSVDTMGPGLMKKAAKSLKKAMRNKKTRRHRKRHRKHRGGADCPEGSTPKMVCENGEIDPNTNMCSDGSAPKQDCVQKPGTGTNSDSTSDSGTLREIAEKFNPI